MTEEKEITINKTELPIQERIVKNDTEFKIVDLEQVIKRLEQENKELQAYKDINEDFKKAWDELNEKYKQLRSALEEIRDYCKFNFVSANPILTKISEVLGDEA